MLAKIMTALVLTAVSCGKATTDKNETPPATNGEDPAAEPAPQPQPQPETPAALSLTIPQDQWAASSYCGAIRPEIPENPVPPYRFDYALLNEKLGGDGLTGWVHGAVPSYEQYVFTYRKEDPDDFMAFFKAEQFSLIPASAEVAQLLPTLKRHDKIRLKGNVFENGSPLTHVMVTGIEIVKKYDKATDNAYNFDLASLNGQERFEVFGLVHATVASDTMGRALVIEHKDLMMPLAVPARHDAVAAEIFRGDIVNVAVKVVRREQGPPHFEIDGDVEQAIKIVDPMINCHGVETEVVGYLAKFEKSPAISTDVYAVRVVDANGIGRNYTLFPDAATDEEFMAIFMGMKTKAEAAWNASAQEPSVVRNFWSKDAIKVRVKGKLNVVSTEQANAQVYIKSVDDIELTDTATP